MLFNSIAYLLFLPLVFAAHWILPHRFRWILLLAASYYFYMSWNVKYVVLILSVTVTTYLMALLIEKSCSERRKRLFVAVAVALCLGLLFFFKYFNFFSDSLNRFFRLFSLKLRSPALSLLLPVGISFYTFQAISYVIDVYRGTTPAEKNFWLYALFVSFFPQLVAGPIERSNNLLHQLREPRFFSYEQGIDGLRLIIWGFFKKVAVADTIAPFVDTVFADVSAYQGFDYALAINLFAVQIYCDFSGYSDIAIGSAKLLGVDLMKNFKSPYFAASIQEHWSRWHISLSQWFRDYFYFPLGGSRCARWKHYRNILLTFITSGLWHGASWTYILWGGLHGCIQVIEQILKKPLTKLRQNRIGRVFCVIVVFHLLNIGWVLFRSASFTEARYIYRHVFDNIFNPSLYFQSSVGLTGAKLLLIIAGTALIALFDFVDYNRDALTVFASFPKWCRCVIGYILLIVVIIAAISAEGANQFVYFQF